MVQNSQQKYVCIQSSVHGSTVGVVVLMHASDGLCDVSLRIQTYHPVSITNKSEEQTSKEDCSSSSWVEDAQVPGSAAVFRLVAHP